MAEERGTLFEDMATILEAKINEKKPASAFFLENVRGLKTHMSDEKKTISIIEEKLRNLGYSYHLVEVRASDFGVPQHRPRLFIFGFLTDLPGRPEWARNLLARNREADNQFVASISDYMQDPKPVIPIKPTLAQILGGAIAGDRKVGFTLRVGGRGSGLQDRRNWDTYEVDGKPLKISWQHGLALQGFPKKFQFPSDVGESQRMKQLGNSVAVPAVAYFAEKMIKALSCGNESR
jgi:DNA (cytosine-5)-methyltransferase 1